MSMAINRIDPRNPYMPSQKSMTIRFYAHSPTKKTVDVTLVDSGATENFMNLKYAQQLQLPIKEFEEPHMVFNIDGMANRSGEIKYYTDLNVQTGQNHTTFRFFLTNIGDSKVILGYPWMAAIQPRIDWKHGWIDHEHLPLVFYIPKRHRGTFIHKKSISEMTMADPSPLSGLPPTY